MPRAFLISYGFRRLRRGPDAAAFMTPAPTLWPYCRGLCRGQGRGRRSGPLRMPNLDGLGSRRRNPTRPGLNAPVWGNPERGLGAG